LRPSYTLFLGGRTGEDGGVLVGAAGGVLVRADQDDEEADGDARRFDGAIAVRSFASRGATESSGFAFATDEAIAGGDGISLALTAGMSA
jgi:hypothetical protein